MNGTLFRQFTVIIFLILFAAPGFAGAESAQADGPQIQFEQTSFDFGFLPPNRATTLRHDFVFRNVGNRDLVIKSLGTACRTTSFCSMKTIAPNQTSCVRLTTVLPADYTNNDSLQRTVRIETNDPHRPELELTMKTRFTYTLRCVPDKIDLGPVPPGDKFERSFNIESLSDVPFKITRCVCDNKLFTVTPGERTTATATLSPGFITDSKTMARGVKISAAPPREAQPGTVFELIKIYTDRPDIPVIEIPVSAVIAPNWLVEPAALFLGILRSPQPAQQDVNLITSIPDLAIKEITSNLAGLATQIFPRQHGFRIHVTYDPKGAAGPVEGELIIHTSSPAVPEIKVAVTAVVKINTKPQQ